MKAIARAAIHPRAGGVAGLLVSSAERHIQVIRQHKIKSCLRQCCIPRLRTATRVKISVIVLSSNIPRENGVSFQQDTSAPQPCLLTSTQHGRAGGPHATRYEFGTTSLGVSELTGSHLQDHPYLLALTSEGEASVANTCPGTYRTYQRLETFGQSWVKMTRTCPQNFAQNLDLLPRSIAP